MADWFSGGSSKSNWFSGGSGSSSFAKQKSAQAKRMIELEEEEEGVDKDSVEYKLRTAKYGKFANNPEAVDTFLKDNAPEKFNAVKAGAQTLAETGKGFVQPVISTANRLATVQNAGVIDAQADKLDRALESIKNSNLSNEQKSALEDQVLKAKTSLLQGELSAAGFDQNTSVGTMFRKTAADLGQVGSLALPVGAARGASTVRNAATGTASGGTTGALTALGSDDLSAGNFAQSIGVGGLVGAAVPATKALAKKSTPTTLPAALTDVEGELVTAAQRKAPKTEIQVLKKQQQFLQDQIRQETQSKLTADALNTGNRKISGQALSTEARAIREGVAKDLGDLAEYGATTWDDQAKVAVDIMNTDYETAKRIAMGIDEPPQGVLGNAVYKGVENRAIKEGDTELLRQLASSQTASRTSRAAQELGVLGVRDPESPVTAMQDLIKARKDSKLKIPAEITSDEADRITTLAADVAKAKSEIVNGGDRLAYGEARVAYDNYIEGLVNQANKKSLKEALKTPGETATNIAGLTKSLRASLDNSALLRQGWKTLLTNPGTWAKNSKKSFVDWVRAAGNKPVLDEVKADIVSRNNSLNGLYKQMKLDVFGLKEEAFPTSLPERIPVVGRGFKGSEAAYTAWQQRTRADLADKYLEIAQRSGVDLTSKKELESIGKFVNSLTGRGNLGKTGERTSKVLNNVFFSPRLLKSNLDVLTAHQFQKGVSPFVRKQAAKNLLQIAVGSATALKLASEVTGGKVEWDPRSSNFGKVKIGDTRFDLSGGMASIATLGARLASLSSKSSTTGEVKPLNSGEFGATTGKDVFYNFFENKLSPAASAISDIVEGKDFEGNKPTAQSTIKNLTLPLIINSYQELKDNPRASAVLPSLIAEGLGVSVNTYGIDSNWNANNSKRVQGFKSKVSSDTFKQANDEFNQQFGDWYGRVSASDDFWKLPQDKRESLVTSKKDSLTDEVLARRGYKYKTQKTDKSTQNLIDELKKR